MIWSFLLFFFLRIFFGNFGANCLAFQSKLFGIFRGYSAIFGAFFSSLLTILEQVF